MKQNNVTNVGSSTVDITAFSRRDVAVQYDASQSRMEITSNGSTDGCIGNC